MFQILDYNKFNNRVMNIQIDWLKKRFDTMIQAVNKTGSVQFSILSHYDANSRTASELRRTLTQIRSLVTKKAWKNLQPLIT